jgi:hypothetical protein
MNPIGVLLINLGTPDAPTPEAVAGPVVDWEEPKCLLCGGGNWSPLVEAPDGAPGGAGLWFVVVGLSRHSYLLDSRETPPLKKELQK